MGSVRIDLSDRIAALNKRATPPVESPLGNIGTFDREKLIELGKYISENPRDQSYAANPVRMVSGFGGPVVAGLGTLAAQGLERRSSVDPVDIISQMALSKVPMGLRPRDVVTRAGLSNVVSNIASGHATKDDPWSVPESFGTGALFGGGLYGVGRATGLIPKPAKAISQPPPDVPPPSPPPDSPLFGGSGTGDTRITSTGQFPGGPPPSGPTPTVTIPGQTTTTGTLPVPITKGGTPKAFEAARLGGLNKPVKTLTELIDIIPKTEDDIFNNLVTRMKDLNKKGTLSDSELAGYEDLLNSIRNHPSLPEGFGDEWDILDAKFKRSKPPDETGGTPVVKTPPEGPITPSKPTGKIKRHPVTGKPIREPVGIPPEAEGWTQTINRYNDLRGKIATDEGTLEDLQEFLRINEQMRSNIDDMTQVYGMSREEIEELLAGEGRIVGRLLDEEAFKEPRVDAIDEQMPAVRIPGENDPTLFDIPITPDTIRTQLPQTMQDIVDAYKILNEGLNTRSAEKINEAVKMLKAVNKDRLKGMPSEYIDRAREIFENVQNRIKTLKETGKSGEIMDWLKPFIDDESGEFDPGGMWKYIKELGRRFIKEEKGTFDPFDRFKKVRRPNWADRPPRVSLHGDEVIPEEAFQADEGTTTQREFKEHFLPREDEGVDIFNPTNREQIDKDTRTMPEGWMNNIALSKQTDILPEAERIYQETNPEQIVKNFALYAKKFQKAWNEFNAAQDARLKKGIPEPPEIVDNFNKMRNLKDLAQSKYERATYKQLEGGIEEEGVKGLIKRLAEDEEGSFDWTFGKGKKKTPDEELEVNLSDIRLDAIANKYPHLRNKDPMELFRRWRELTLASKGKPVGSPEMDEAYAIRDIFDRNPEWLKTVARLWKEEKGELNIGGMWDAFKKTIGRSGQKGEEPQVNIPRTSSTWPGAGDRQAPRVNIPIVRRPGPGAGKREFREAGKNVARSILRGLNQGQKEARNLMTSFDVSWPFRQGATNLHRPEFWKNLYPMVRHFTTEAGYNRAMNKIKNGRRYEQKVKAGVKFTDLDKVREEDFEAKWVSKLPGVKHSNRAYTAMGNTMRDQLFDAFMDAAEQSGIKFGDGSDANSKALAAFINTTTGRANLGEFEAAAKKLNSIFFSPQFVVSRLDMMRRLVDPRSMKGVDPKLQSKLRGEAYKSMSGVLSMGLISAAISSLAMGNTSTLDPTSADFLKLRIGDTRLDFTGGFQQYLRAPAQIMMGEINRSNKFGEGTNAAPYVTAMRFLLSKLSPLGSLTTDIAFGEDVIGRETRTPTGIARGLLERTVPLSFQDIAEVGVNDPKMLPVTIPAGLFGAGVQSYESRSNTGSNSTRRPSRPTRPQRPRRPARPSR